MATWLFALAQAAQPAPAAPDQNDSVVVIGKRLRDTGLVLAECLARDCPPREDIEASLAHAEAQVVAGDYVGSRSTLLKSRSRNRRYAAELPIEVSDLHRANARVADLNGLREAGRIGVFDVVDALKAGLGRDDRVLAAGLEVGDAFVASGRLDAALSQYRSIGKEARKRGASLVAGMASFRRATLLTAYASVFPGDRYRAERAVAELERSTEPGWAPFREAMRVVPGILAFRTDKGAALDAQIALTPPLPPGSVRLLFAPPVDKQRIAFGVSPGGLTEWLNVAFRIAANGRVKDVRTMAASSGVQASWIATVGESLLERRYARFRDEDGNPGSERIERWSFISDLAAGTGSGIRVRSSARRIEVFDLTPTPTPARVPVDFGPTLNMSDR